MSASGTDFAKLMEPVARLVWGDPNKQMSSRTELRWGAHGSRSVDLGRGLWFDHKSNEGGGVLDLLSREKGLSNGEQFDWLREQGFEIEDGRPSQAARHSRPRIVATYDYVDAAGDLLFQVVRMEPKTFRQRRRAVSGDDPKSLRDGWVWSVKGLPLVPYRLPELQEAIAAERQVLIVEGEKDADNLVKWGLTATCNPMGAGKWPEDFPEYFRDAHVVILPDNDEAGRAHRDLVGASLQSIAASVRVAELPNLPDKGDVSYWMARGGTVEALNDIVARARPWQPPPPGSAYQAVWFADLDKWTAEVEWLVKGLVTKGSIVLFYGPSGCGKSFLAQHIALSVCRGEPVLGKHAEKGGCVYIAAEGKKGFKKRLRAYRQFFAITDPLPFVLIPVSVDLYNDDGDTAPLITEINAMAAHMPVPLALVVIDTLAAVSPGANENASEDMTRILRHCQQIQEACNTAVIIVHHKNAAGDRPRGHTSLFAGVDTGIEVVRDDQGQRSLKVAKQKDAEDGERLGFHLQSVSIPSASDPAATSCVVGPDTEIVTQTGDRAKSNRLPDRLMIALQCVRTAVNEYGQLAPAELQLPIGTRVVNVDYWRGIFDAKAFVGEEPPPTVETMQKARKRSLDGLLAKGFIAGSRPWMWLTGKGERGT